MFTVPHYDSFKITLTKLHKNPLKLPYFLFLLILNPPSTLASDLCPKQLYWEIKDLPEFNVALQKAWSKETSLTPEQWSTENIARGQCAVSALVVQDFFGGEIVNALVDLGNGNLESHYKNKIEDKEIDLTKDQYPNDVFIPKGVPKLKGYQSTREYILSFEATRTRYERLKTRLVEILQQAQKTSIEPTEPDR